MIIVIELAPWANQSICFSACFFICCFVERLAEIKIDWIASIHKTMSEWVPKYVNFLMFLFFFQWFFFQLSWKSGSAILLDYNDWIN